MRRNRSITSFFKPVPTNPPPDTSQSTPIPPPARKTSIVAPVFLPPSSSSSSPPPPPPLFLGSSPAPQDIRERPAPLSRSFDDVIPGSDDDDDGDTSSDDELPDLLSAYRQKPVQVPVPATQGADPCVTPKAKRTAVAVVSSPITPGPGHEFDMKALVENSKRNDAAEARAQQIALLDLDSDGPEDSDATGSRRSPRTPKTIAIGNLVLDGLPDVGSDEDKGKGRDRLHRAVQRTEATSARFEWRFFSEDSDTINAATVGSPFPKEAATGCWSFLESTKTRQAYFEDGIVYDIQEMHPSLPDEVFLWVLHQVPGERSPRLRDEYVRLVGICCSHVRHHVDDTRLDMLFQAVGASSKAMDLSEMVAGTSAINSEREKQYNWESLQSVLRLIAIAAGSMNLSSLIHSTILLLRLGMDRLVRENISVQSDYALAIHSLADAAPSVSWDKYVSTAHSCL